MSERKSGKKKSKAPVLIVLLIIIALIGAAAFYVFGGTRTANLDQETAITIPNGSSAKMVSTILKDNDLVMNKLSFEVYIRMSNAAADLKPGDYTFGPGKVTYSDILEMLKRGNLEAEQITITIPEGLTVLQMAESLESQGAGSADKFLEYAGSLQIPYDYIPQGEDYTQLEGFLYPDTYCVGKDWSEAQIVDLMLAQFDKNWTPERRAKAEELGLTAKQVVTVASLIEREVRVDSERATVASVIYNRIAQNMPLQIDATIQYILGKQKDRLLYSDLEIDSPYNTYKNMGLPPGPIASPGVACIDAALNPEQTEYLFYQTTVEGDGSHYFCKTYDEHLAYMKKKE